MVIKYNAKIEPSAIQGSFTKIINQTYKLLPTREEGNDWIKPLETIIEEVAGMDRLFFGQQEDFFSLLCKMEGLFTLTQEEDFYLFRRIIFECLGLLSELRQCLDMNI